MTTKYDAIIIGTGQSGPSLAARLAGAGMKVAIIERKLFGGTCVNTGCIPTKTLVASARAAYMARRGADFGVMIDGPIAVDMKKVKARKDSVVRQSNQGVEGWLKNMENCTVYEGHARFEDPHTLSVSAERLEADKIFINVGARVPTLDEMEKEQIIKTLEMTGWRVSGEKGAAKLLGMKPTTLEARMKKLGIKRKG